MEPEETFESGEQQVAVVVSRRMRPKDSSAEIEARSGALWTIRDGMVTSIRVSQARGSPRSRRAVGVVLWTRSGYPLCMESSGGLVRPLSPGRREGRR